MKKFIATVLVLSLPLFAFADSNVTVTTDAHSSSNPSSAFILTGYVQEFDFSAANGYKLSNVTFDGSSVGTPSSLNVTGDASDHTIGVTSVGSGSMQIWCSGPTAPGWNVSLPGGGCGHSELAFRFNQVMPDGTLCPFFSGCIIKQ